MQRKQDFPFFFIVGFFSFSPICALHLKKAKGLGPITVGWPRLAEHVQGTKITQSSRSFAMFCPLVYKRPISDFQLFLIITIITVIILLLYYTIINFLLRVTTANTLQNKQNFVILSSLFRSTVALFVC